ncbi:MAG: S8 family peptidase [Miltoncostaeaceae bacterium]
MRRASLGVLAGLALASLPAIACGATTGLVAPGGDVGGEVPVAERLSSPTLRTSDLPTGLPSAAGHGRASREPWIVAARPGPKAERAAAAVGARIVDRELGLFVAPEARAARLVLRLKRAGRFLYAEPDVSAGRQGLPGDPRTPEQGWAPHAVPEGLVPPAPGAPGDGAGIALIEDGADQTHPDLGHVRNPRPPRLADNPTSSQLIEFGSGLLHGTAVAGVATAAANGVGVVGVWPGHTTQVFAGGATCSGITAAILTAVRQRPAVINMSYGFFVDDLLADCFSHVRATQLAFGAGVTLVAAAGNSLNDPFNPVGRKNPLLRPASDPHVLTVGALNSSLISTGFSQRGTGLDLAAPGEGILAPIPLSLDTDDGAQDGYAVVDGTSFAAPIVSAQVAMLRRARPALTPDQINTMIRVTARDLGRPGWDRSYGWGLADLPAAIASPAPRRDLLEPNDDIVWVDGRGFARPDAPRLRKRRAETIRSVLDYQDDPADVIPVSVPPRSTLLVDLRPIDTNVDLMVFDRTARTYTKRLGRIVSSRRPGLRTERVSIRNTTPQRQKVYVVAEIRRNRVLSTEYVLRLRNVRR